jgi:menaquinone-dependent protoporphyrinogen IX oxidase
MRMRVVVVYFPVRSKEKMRTIAQALARGIEANGHRVEVIDGLADSDKKITMYDYVIVGTEQLSAWSSKILDKIPMFLSSAGHLSGKRSFAFVLKQPLFAFKALTRLMKAMEKEGMYLKFSEVLSTAAVAQEIGKRLKIEPN